MRALVATLAVLVSGLVAAPAQADAGRLDPHHRWLLDGEGRVRILDGVNMVYKKTPYAPDATGFGPDDARFLQRHGFTTVRLGLIWKAVEPQPGQYDDAYLDRVRATTRILARHGIWTLLDFHQDLYNERFQGEGAPDWAVMDDGLPAEPQAGFPGNYFGMPALNRAFDHFWANDPGPGGVGLQDRYAAAWAHVADRFENTPKVLGFDLFNEPWPGSVWQQCANPAGCPVFDAELQAFTEKQVAAIRAVDERTPVFYEPNVLFNSGARTNVQPKGRNLAFSFHDYCLSADVGAGDFLQQPCDQLDDTVWANAAAHVEESGHPGLLTEFGATTDGPTIRHMVNRAGAHATGWQFWAYCGCDDPTTTGPGNEQALVRDPAKRPTGHNVDHQKLHRLAVPHPQVVAGTPVHWHYGYTKHRFRLAWLTARADGPGRWAPGSRTRIFVPRSAYRHGYRVTVRHGHVVRRHGRQLVVAQDGTPTRVHLVLTRR